MTVAILSGVGETESKPTDPQRVANRSKIMAHPENILLVNNTNADIRGLGIVEALRDTGALPEDFADLFVVTRRDDLNADGSPRFILDAA